MNTESSDKGKTPPKGFNDRLRTLAAWLLKRADEPHNELTTRSMLRHKVDEALSAPIAKCPRGLKPAKT